MSSTPSSAPQAPSRDFPRLPDSSRLWIFGVSRPLGREEEGSLLARVDAFLEEWKAHGHPLSAARDWRYGRFLLVAVDDRITPPSGCSIDALVRQLRGVEEELSVEIVGGAPVWYRGEGSIGDGNTEDGTGGGPIHRVSRAEFRGEMERGTLGPETVVFDLSLTRLEELRAGRWELPPRSSWHARYLPNS
jgi:hypothetical protein